MLYSIANYLTTEMQSVLVDGELYIYEIQQLWQELQQEYPEYSNRQLASYSNLNDKTKISFTIVDQDATQAAIDKIYAISRRRVALVDKYTAVLDLFTETDKNIRHLVLGRGNMQTVALAVKALFNMCALYSRFVSGTMDASSLAGIVSEHPDGQKLTFPFYDCRLSVSNENARKACVYFCMGEYINAFVASGWIAFQTAQKEFGGASHCEQSAVVVKPSNFTYLVYKPQMCIVLSRPVMDKLKQYLQRLKLFAAMYGFKHNIAIGLQKYCMLNHVLTLTYEQTSVFSVCKDNLQRQIKEYCATYPQNKQILVYLREKELYADLVYTYYEIHNAKANIVHYTVGTCMLYTVTYTKQIRGPKCCEVLPDTYKWHYNTLTNYLKAVIDLIVDAAQYLQPKVYLSTTRQLKKEQIKTIQTTLKHDFPELFFISLPEHCAWNEFVVEISILNSRIPNVVQEQRNLLRCARGLANYWRHLGTDMFVEFYQYLIDNVYYNKPENEKEDEFYREYSVMGCLIDKSCVCQGFALAAQLISNLCGYKCMFVSGLGKDEPHAWNKVWIAGEWHNVDFTWNVNQTSFVHMCCSDVEFPDHVPDNDFDYPVCTSMAQFYYVRKGYYAEVDPNPDVMEPRIYRIVETQIGVGTRTLYFCLKDFSVSDFGYTRFMDIIRNVAKKRGLEILKEGNSITSSGKLITVEITAAQ